MISDTVVAGVIVASGAVFIVSAQLARGRAVVLRGPSVRVAPSAQLAPYLFWVPYVVVAFWLGPIVGTTDPVRTIGLVLTVAGIGLSLWAIATLGRHYDLVLELHKGHELVRRGPFAWTRHPVYTGLLLHFVGACVATGNLLLLAGTLLGTLPALYMRARTEEALLREQFGAEYERYAREVPMLVPGLGGR